MKLIKYLAIICLIPPAFGSERPNILFLSMDDLKPELACYGSEIAISPNIDRLADQGVLFEHHYVQQAICSATRASMFTGLRPDTTRVWDISSTCRENCPIAFTMQQYFREAGYVTAGSGKVMHGFTRHDPLSWTDSFIDPSELPFAGGREPALYQQYQGEAIHKAVVDLEKSGLKVYKEKQVFMAERNAKPSIECLDLPDDAYSDGAMTVWGIERLKEYSQSDKPFFLTLGFRKPHLPFVAPKKYWDMFDRESIPTAVFTGKAKGSPDYAYQPGYELNGYSDIDIKVLGDDLDKQRELIHGYYACVAYVDAQIGMLLDTLEETGLADNTIIVLWGDHGWHLGDHNMWCKHTNFEQATRSPLIIHAPGMASGVKTTSMAESVDIFSTLCDLAGLPIPDQLEGDSLVPVLKDPSVEVKPVAISQYPDWNKKTLMGYALRDQRYRLVAWVDRSAAETGIFARDMVQDIELYDYKTDPLETVSQSDNPEYMNVVQSLMAELEKYFSNRQS
ncbi:MAG: sulfatase [Puniceicoccaceae bacterium]